MKILVACEESQAVCKAFRKKGHQAYSLDIIPCSGGHPEWHLQMDAIKALSPIYKWDMIIAFPPCTYLSVAGANSLYRGKKLNFIRYKKGMLAKRFFMRILNAKCKKICVENPTQLKIFNIPKHAQTIQPYMFGHPFLKRTNLWLKGLKPLKATNIVDVESCTRQAGNWFNKGGKDRQKNRSKTFPGIAAAMAEQWG